MCPPVAQRARLPSSKSHTACSSLTQRATKLGARDGRALCLLCKDCEVALLEAPQFGVGVSAIEAEAGGVETGDDLHLQRIVGGVVTHHDWGAAEPVLDCHLDLPT